MVCATCRTTMSGSGVCPKCGDYVYVPGGNDKRN